MTVHAEMHSEEVSGKRPQCHPKEHASCFSKFLGLWMWPLFRLGASRPLEATDVWELPQSYQPEKLLERLDAAWDVRRPSLGRALFKAFRYELLSILARDAPCFVGLFFIPMLVAHVLDFIQNEETCFCNAYLVPALLAAASIQGTCVAASYVQSTMAGTHLRTVLMNAVFRKALCISSEARARGSAPVSRILELLSVDAERVWHAAQLSHWIVGQFTILVATCILMTIQIGIAFLGGMLTMIFLIISQAVLAKSLGWRRRRMQHWGELRLSLLKQVVEGIRVVKLYHYEDPLLARLIALRHKEERELRMVLLLRAVNSATAYLIPSLASCAVFAGIAVTGSELSLKLAFSAIAGLLVLRGPLGAMPLCVTNATEGLVSLGRLKQFFELDDGRLWSSSPWPSNGAAENTLAVHLRNAHFAWPSPENGGNGQVRTEGPRRSISMHLNLQADDIQIKPGSLVCCVGPVGSGKTSLCLALLREMPHQAGESSVSGRVAFVPQVPWIVSGTVRQNVLLMSTSESIKEDAKLQIALNASQLGSDMDQLPAREDTEIGQNGVNLSGGQRARVGLARVLADIAQADTVILDDTFAAVDAHVAECLVKDVIFGCCASLTRIIVLSSYAGLGIVEKADSIINVSGGIARQFFSYDEFCKSAPESIAELQPVNPTSPVASPAAGFQSFSSPTPSSRGLPQWIASELPKWYLEDQKSTNTRKLSEKGGSLPLKEAGQLYLPEERHVGILSLSTYRLYFGHVWKGAGCVVLLLIIASIVAAEGARLVSDVMLGQWAAASDGNNIDALRNRYIVMTLATVLLSLIRAILFMTFAHRAASHVHTEMLTCLLRASVPQFFDVVPVGRIMSRFGKDLDTVGTLLPHYLLETLQDVAMILSTCGLVAVTAPLSMVILVPGAILLLRARILYTRTSRELQRLEGVSRTPVFSLCTEAMQGVTIIRAHKLQEMFCKRFAAVSSENAKIFFHLQHCLPMIIAGGENLAALIVAATAFSALAFGDVHGKVIAALAVTYSIQLAGKLQWATRQSCEAEHHLTAVERLGHFRQIPAERYEPKDSSPHDFTESWPPTGEVLFESVTLRYRSHLPDVLRSVNFHIRAGERVGLIGRTGSGKSTIAATLFRLVEPRGGRVLIDGVDISTLSLSRLRQGLAIIPQEPLMWADSIRANLDPVGRCSDDDVFWKMLELVSLADVVRCWPKHLETDMGEGGDSLSVGQRQLLAVARVLLRPKIRLLVLDEATANVDEKSDEMLQKALREAPALQGATVMAIAHRLGTLCDYNRILALEATGPDSATQVREILNPKFAFKAEAMLSDAQRAARRQVVSI